MTDLRIEELLFYRYKYKVHLIIVHFYKPYLPSSQTTHP